MIWLLAVKSALGRVFDWLSHRSFWQLVCIGLAGWLILTRFQLADARSDSARWEKQFKSVKSELDRISSKKNEQRQETAERIRVVTRVITEADKRAREVEDAPLPGQCATPPEILRADL